MTGPRNPANPRPHYGTGSKPPSLTELTEDVAVRAAARIAQRMSELEAEQGMGKLDALRVARREFWGARG